LVSGNRENSSGSGVPPCRRIAPSEPGAEYPSGSSTGLEIALIDLAKLDAVLPVTGIESQELGCIRGPNPDAELVLHQPPAGQTEVMVRPSEAFEQALVAAGWAKVCIGRGGGPRFVAPIERRPWLLNFHSEPYLFVPMSHVISRLRALGPQQARIADFLDRYAETAGRSARSLDLCGIFPRRPLKRP
jgi:hypothetical protein